jgi:ribose 5-phosphate isomerase B
MTRIALGADHAGFPMKEAIKAYLEKRDYEIVDFGTASEAAVDYPDYCRPAAESVARGDCDFGVVFGGSGNGEAMVANKVSGIRCGVCWNVESARLTKEHNNANVIALGGRMVSTAEGVAIVDAWLNATFQSGRHQQRIEKIEPNYTEGAKKRQ